MDLQFNIRFSGAYTANQLTSERNRIMFDPRDTQPSDIPPEIDDLYEGEWIAWDCEARVVLAHDVDLDKLMPATDAAYAAGRLIYFHHILPAGVEIVGGL